jgi:hypothetical protein
MGNPVLEQKTPVFGRRILDHFNLLLFTLGSFGEPPEPTTSKEAS